MDTDLRKELDEIHALARDNHRMLRAIRRDQWLGFIGRIVVWIIVVALPLYFYQQYIQPFVTKFSPMAGKNASGSFGFPTSAEVQKLINSIKAGPGAP